MFLPDLLGLSAQLDLYPLPNHRVRLDLSARSGLLDPLQLNQHPQDLSDLSGQLPYYPRLPDLLVLSDLSGLQQCYPHPQDLLVQ